MTTMAGFGIVSILMVVAVYVVGSEALAATEAAILEAFAG